MGEPSQSLTVRQPVTAGLALLPQPAEWELMTRMAGALFQSGLLPTTIKSPQAAVAVIQKGRELGIPPMQAMTGIVVIQGKPTCGAELMAALVYRDHGDDALRITETTNDRCTIAYRRRSWTKPETYTFSMDDAKRAGLAGGNWAKYPAAMLRARAISAVARMAFADSIGGMYCPDEMGATVTLDDSGEVIAVELPAEEPRAYDAQTGERVPTPLRTAAPAKAEGGKAQAQRAAGVAAMATAEPAPAPLKWVLNMAVDGCQAWNPKTNRHCPSDDLDTQNLAGWAPEGARLCSAHASELKAGGKLTVINQPAPVEEAPPPDDLDAILDGEMVER